MEASLSPHVKTILEIIFLVFMVGQAVLCWVLAKNRENNPRQGGS